MRAVSIIVATAALASSAGPLHADDAIAPNVLTAIKDATVYIKVRVEKNLWMGSGFVWKTDGDTTYIVTNHHVIEPKVEEIINRWRLEVPRPESRNARRRHGQFPPVPWSYHFTPRLIVRTFTNAAVTVVFRSGTPDEQSVRAEVLAADPDMDLAILKAKNVRHVPAVIKPTDDSTLVETTPVCIVGFPLGGNLNKLVADPKRNPPVTVGKASISSLRRNKAGQLVYVQIDGAMNHGNSGGPVVDTQGRLVGVSDLVFQSLGGQGFGWAIPFREVLNISTGRLGKPYLYAEGGATIHVEVALVDPFDHVRSATLHYLILNHVDKKPKPADCLKNLAGCRALPLKIDERVGFGHFSLQHGLSDVTVACQGLATDDAGHERLTPVLVETIKLSGPGAGQTVVPVPPPGEDAEEEQLSADDLETILAELKSGDSNQVGRATRKLVHAKPKQPNPAVAKALVVVLLGKNSSTVRANAAWAMENWGTPESLPALVRATRDASANVQSHAKRAIAEIKARQ